jgi:Zn-dependent M28 family amino/carboxypeptidase
MKMKLIPFFLLLFTARLSAQNSPADSIIQMSALQEALLFLSQDSLQGRLTGSGGISVAGNYLAYRFKAIGLDTLAGNQGYFDPFTANFEGKRFPARNVIAILPGLESRDSFVIFSAHYDHVGRGNDMPENKDYTNKDDIFNGANDNASGVAAVLELARYFKSRNENRYTLMFVAFSGEEMQMLGSGHLAGKLDRRKIRAMINLEMLGIPKNGKCFVISSGTKVLRNSLNNYLKMRLPAMEADFFEADPYPGEQLYERSDHYPFARKIKTAFTIMASSPMDAYYHTVDDEYQTIDFDFLLKATRYIALATEQFTR